MNYYTKNISISYTDIATELSRDGIEPVTSFLKELANHLSIRYVPEDGAKPSMPEDVYFGSIIESITNGIEQAQQRFKEATRRAFSDPTREQVERHIADLMRKRNERLAKEALEAAEKESAEERYESLLPETSEEEKEFITLFNTYPVHSLMYDMPMGTYLNILCKDGTSQQMACDPAKYNRILNYWDRWNDSKSLKNLKAVGEINPICDWGGGNFLVEPQTYGPNDTHIKKTVDILVDNMLKQQKQHEKDLAAAESK